jgi:hypothetical protein
MLASTLSVRFFTHNQLGWTRAGISVGAAPSLARQRRARVGPLANVGMLLTRIPYDAHPFHVCRA